MVAGPDDDAGVAGVPAESLGGVQQPPGNAPAPGLPAHGKAADFGLGPAAAVGAQAAGGLAVQLRNPEIAAGPFQVAVADVRQVVGQRAVHVLAEPLPVRFGVQVAGHEIILGVREQVAHGGSVVGAEPADGKGAGLGGGHRHCHCQCVRC